MKHKIYLTLTIFGCFFMLNSCNKANQSNDDNWTNPLDESEIALLQLALDKIDTKEILIYKEKIKALSKKSFDYNSLESISTLEEFKDIRNWIKNEVKNFPLLFYYIIYEEKVKGEEKSMSLVLLWDLARELHSGIYEDMIRNDNYNNVYLIKQLLPLYSDN